VKNQRIRHVRLTAHEPGLPEDHMAETQRLRERRESLEKRTKSDPAAQVARFARLIDDAYKGDTGQIKSIEKRIGIDLEPYRGANWEKSLTESDRAKLRALVDDDSRFENFIDLFIELT
jgi:hypothetical protein